MHEIEKIVSRFRESGLKITPQRVSIFKLLQGNRDHPSAEDIYRQVLKVHPSISFTTVYKTLQTLLDMGEIQELTIDTESADRAGPSRTWTRATKAHWLPSYRQRGPSRSTTSSCIWSVCVESAGKSS